MSKKIVYLSRFKFSLLPTIRYIANRNEVEFRIRKSLLEVYFADGFYEVESKNIKFKKYWIWSKPPNSDTKTVIYLCNSSKDTISLFLKINILKPPNTQIYDSQRNACILEIGGTQYFLHIGRNVILINLKSGLNSCNIHKSTILGFVDSDPRPFGFGISQMQYKQRGKLFWRNLKLGTLFKFYKLFQSGFRTIEIIENGRLEILEYLNNEIPDEKFNLLIFTSNFEDKFLRIRPQI